MGISCSTLESAHLLVLISTELNLYDQTYGNNFHGILTEDTSDDRRLWYEYSLISLIHGHVGYLS